jgi:hypothetical protein
MISKSALNMFLDDCNASGDTKTAMLINCLLESYDQSDSEKVQKTALIRSSAEVLSESRRKDQRIAELVGALEAQSVSQQATVAAFRKIYEMSVFGNEFFKSKPLLQLWVAVERFLGSKTEQEFRERNIELQASLAELFNDKYLLDMRNNMLNFSNYMEDSNEAKIKERERDTARDNDSDLQEPT